MVIGVAILLTYVANRYELCLNWYSIPSGLVFFMVGCMLKGRLKDLKMNRWLLLLLLMAVSTAHVAIALYNGDAAIDHIVGKTAWLYWIGATFGIAALYLFANLSRMDVQENPHVNNFVQIISTGTILILCYHMILINYTMDFFLVNHSFYIPLVIREMLLATIITVVCVPVILLIRRYCPILIGNRR